MVQSYGQTEQSNSQDTDDGDDGGQSTEQKILDAARDIFRHKGMAGARMQEIADRAGINKALLHYYFRNKQRLFERIFLESFDEAAPKFNEIFRSERSLHDKIAAFVDGYIEFIAGHPELPAFIINEMTRDPTRLLGLISERRDRPDPWPLMAQIQAEAEAGRIAAVNSLDLMANLVALCVFPFAARPMLLALTGISPETYDAFLAQRKESVVRFVQNALRPERSL